MYLGVYQKYFLPARRLSNPPEFCKSGGENRHLATLASAQQANSRGNALAEENCTVHLQQSSLPLSFGQRKNKERTK
jgi:hypothetical protein